MDEMSYFVLDIETCPVDLESYEPLSEDDKKKKLNPMDSKIVAIGIRHNNENKIIMKEGDEKGMLEEFWKEWREMQQKDVNIKAAGFNIANFDIPFIVTRSFVNNVAISPFTVKFIIDLRDKVNAYRYPPSRGTLKEFALAMEMEDFGMDGSEVAGLCKRREFEKLKDYLINDLVITDNMYKRLRDTNILYINKW